MMKTTLFAIAAMAAVSCVKEQIADNSAIVNPNLVECTFYAGTETSETKAAFSEDAYPQIGWQGNEEISVLGTNTANQKFSTSSTGTTAEFNGVADLTDEVLYAVYPYDAAVELTADGKLSKVTVPAVQTATAGSFDPKAYIAVAKSTDKEHFAFKAVGGFVKFQLEDATNVKSVTMVGNDPNTNMACSATIAFNENGSISHGSPYVNGTASTSVKLEGIFETGKEYFMIVRPQYYTGGVTLYIEYTDGTVLSRKGTAALFESGKVRNYIRNLGTLKKSDFTQVNDLYSLYNLGYSIEIAGKSYNKSNLNLTTKLINTNDQVISDNGLYFIDPTVTNISINKENGFSNLFVIGNNQVQKATISLGNTIRCGSNSQVCFKNISILPYTANMFVHNNKDATIKRIAFDACNISLPTSGKFFIFNDDTRSINECAIYNCDIKVTENTQSLITARENYTLIDLYNNIFYSEDNRQTFKLFRSDRPVDGSNYTACPVEIKDIRIENNTFINVYPEKNNNFGYIYTNKVTGSYSLKNNLFELENLITLSGAYRVFLNCVDNEYPTENSFVPGYMFAIPNEGEAGKCSIKAWAGNDNPGTIYGKTESGFSSFDYNTPTFIKTSAKAGIGATR